MQLNAYIVVPFFPAERNAAALLAGRPPHALAAASRSLQRDLRATNGRSVNRWR